MKKQMTEAMSVQAHAIDTFSKEEIADAYETLVANQQEFLSDTEGGRYLRREAMKHFKDSHPEYDTIEQLAMQADLEYNVDVKNACTIKLNAQKYAEELLNA